MNTPSFANDSVIRSFRHSVIPSARPPVCPSARLPVCPSARLPAHTHPNMTSLIAQDQRSTRCRAAVAVAHPRCILRKFFVPTVRFP